jgi:hypothetical protein
MNKEDERDREWKAFLDKHKEEERFADKLAEYLNKKYEDFFKKKEEEYRAIPHRYVPMRKYGVSVHKIGDKAEWNIDTDPDYCLPWITIFNEKLTVGLPDFWSTEHALGEKFSRNYGTFLDILKEIENKENWEKYKNDDMFGDEIFLYERADEVANEVNNKYGTNIVFRGGEDCWFETTFSIKDKSLEEVIKEIERNIPVLYEASKKACNITFDSSYYFGFIFNKPIPKRTAEQIEKIRETGVRLGYAPIILRYKLKYLPIILATSVHGPQKVGEGVPFPFGFGKFKWIWSEEDQRIFEELKSKVETRIEKREWICSSYKGEQIHVFWYSKVLELKEVEEEIEKIRKGKLLSSDNEKDAELIKDEEFIKNYEKKMLVKDYKKKLKTKNIPEDERIKILAEAINEDVKVRINRFCKNIKKVKDKVGDDFYLSLILSSEEAARLSKTFNYVHGF